MKSKTTPRTRATVSTDRIETFRTVYASVGPWEIRVEEDLSPESLAVRVSRYSEDDGVERAGEIRPMGSDGGSWVSGLVAPAELMQLSRALAKAVDALATPLTVPR